MARRKREGTRSGETPTATRLPGAETEESTRTAVMWLELAEGAMREALVERLAQAHMSGVLLAAPIETPTQNGQGSVSPPPPADCELTPVDVASGLVLGFGPPEPAPSSDDVEAGTPLAALERAILPALLRPPCVMSFTGGRGSSLVLAAAVQLARSEGLELPVPATIQVP